jgi:hypothetical protein
MSVGRSRNSIQRIQMFGALGPWRRGQRVSWVLRVKVRGREKITWRVRRASCVGTLPSAGSVRNDNSTRNSANARQLLPFTGCVIARRVAAPATHKIANHY